MPETGSGGVTRLLPLLTDSNRHFWEGGGEDKLNFLHCAACSHYVHPPLPNCPLCMQRDLEVRAVSGRASLLSWTVNHQPWIPGFDPPYVIALVAIEEQPTLRLMTNIVDCEIENLVDGLQLEVVFESAGEGVFLPLFKPVDGPA